MGLMGEHAVAELRRKALLERLELELELQVVDIVCAWASYTDRHQTRGLRCVALCPLDQECC